MKTHLPAFFTWLTLAVLGDWLITRTLARAAIFIPKSAATLKIFSAITVSGQLATSLTGVLSFLTLGWIAWQHFKWQRNLTLGVSCAGLLLVNFIGLFIPPAGWWAISFHLLMITGIISLTWYAWRYPLMGDVKIAISCVAVTLLVGNLYQSLNQVYIQMKLPGPPIVGTGLFNFGEFMVVASVVPLWWAFGQKASKRVWIMAAIPTVLFVIPRLTTPAMTGIMAIWSMGLTLYLPWLFYALAIWLASLTAFHSFQRGDTAGAAVLLLAAGGIAPQMSIQGFLGLIALWILVYRAGDFQPVFPTATEHRNNTRAGFHQLDRI